MKILYNYFSLFFIFLILTGCSTPLPKVDVTGKRLISLKGKSLTGKVWKLPEMLQGNRSILLIGYKQKSQFDIDRWLLGLNDSKVKVSVFEIPAINSFFASLFAEKIDEGMRRGIPADIWSAVITMYGEDGKSMQEFTGNEDPNNSRVMVLDKTGKIIYFYDDGYSVGALKALLKSLE